MRQTLVAGNWKLNGSSAGNKTLVDGILDGLGQIKCEVAICPPYPYLSEVSASIAGSALKMGAQNASEQESGAFTGEVSVAMLKEIGCEYVILGHSERRALYNESDELVADKFAAAVAAGLKPMLCLGETLEERESGVTEEVVGRQLQAVLDKVGVAGLGDAVIAYEPVWACLLYTSPSPRDQRGSRMPSSA